MLAACIFWACLSLVGWTYVGYPLLARWWLRGAAQPGAPMVRADGGPASGGAPPQVTVVVAAHNEEACIGERIDNLLAQEYDADRLEVLVGSDGSSDGTAQVVASRASPRVRLLDFPVNRGKASVLNDLVAQSRGEITVFTDANTVFAPGTVAALVRPFADPAVGAVCGELLLERAGGGSNRDHDYWDVERRLKAFESARGGLLGANGGVYAIRTRLYEPLPAATICDDFVVAMNIAQGGHRLVYEAAAIAREAIPTDMAEEFRRRVRIGMGNYQALFGYPQYLLRAPMVRRFTYLSHKVLRWLVPQLLLVELACCALLPGTGYRAFLWLQLAGMAVLAGAFLLRRRLGARNPLGKLLHVAVLNAAFALAFLRYIRGNAGGTWRRTARA